jgi:hypothetical protein
MRLDINNKKHKYLRVIFIISIILFLIYSISNNASSQQSMSNYCYIPPFVTDSNTPPNVLIIYEKGSDILERAYGTTYYKNPSEPYYGFFDPYSNYEWSNTYNAFVRSTTCSPADTRNCISGDILNWALMSSLDISRRVLVGFGWPETGAANSAGDVFTYTGDLISYGQWSGSISSVSTVVNAGGSNYAYTFCLSKATGSNPTGLKVRVNSGTSAPSCTGKCSGTCSEIISGSVAMKFTTEKREGSIAKYRRGLIQKYIDTDMDYKYDANPLLRLGIKRWNNGNDKQEDIMKNSGMTDSDRASYFKSILTAISKAPPDDPNTAYLGNMMKDNINYFKGSSCSYCDNDSWTQTPYDWSTDTAKECRKNFVLYITTGRNLGQDSDKMSPLPSACQSLTYTDAFPTNTCYAYNTDLSTETGMQNIRTYVVHVNYGGGLINADKLKYASRTVGGGDYLSANKPQEIESRLEEAFINILSTAASASTVATLTTQTRESSTLTQAYFYPKYKIPGTNIETALKWVGFSRLIWSDPGANLREDTTNYGILDLIKDKIINFYYDATTVSYRIRTYSDSDGDTRIDTCSGTEKANEELIPIWEAQSLLVNRNPSEDDTDKRNIKTAIGDSNGVVSLGTPFTDFTTSLDSAFQPYWNYSSYCSDKPSRWCSLDLHCNYCSSLRTSGIERSCLTNQDCYYCNGDKSKPCSTTLSCTDPNFSGTCLVAGSACGSGICIGDCYKYWGACTDTSSLVCNVDYTTPCSTLGETCTNGFYTGKCVGKCSSNSSVYCASDSDCVEDYRGIGYSGSACVTTDNCIAASPGTCVAECNKDCAKSIIKYVRGYDKPNPSGGNFRIRHLCKEDSDCPSGTCQLEYGSYGTCSSEARDIIKTMKLGDIVYSTPRISPDGPAYGYAVRYNDDTYREFIDETIEPKIPIVIIGANDGMVHAFKLSKIRDIIPPTADGGGKQVAMFSDTLTGTTVPQDLGKELWAYIPYNVLPYLRWFCDTSYCHIPMLDARFTILDASINGNADSTRSKTSWKRLLIGTMGVGGKSITIGSRSWSSSIFVIDITDPQDPKFMWEKPLPDRTLTTSNPGIVRLGDADKNGSWYIVIGSGPSSVLTDGITYKTGNAKIYIFNLRDGSVTEIDTGLSGYAIGDILSTDLDSDYQVDDLYFGTYGLSGDSLTGNLYRLRIKNGSSYQSVVEWDIESVVNVGRPIFASPEVAQDAKGNIWIYFGTGLYLTMKEALPTTTEEYLYGVIEKETCWKNGCSSPYSNFLNVTNISVTSAKAVKVGCFCEGNLINTIVCSSPGNCTVNCGANENTVILNVQGATLTGTSVPSSCSSKTDEDAIRCLYQYIINNYDGWKKAITGEKIFAKPFVAGGLVDFTSFKPTSTPCSLGGTTQLISLNFTTGTAYIQPSIYLPGGTTYANYSSIAINSSVSLGTGVPPLGESLIALPLSGDTYKVITQVSGGLPGTALNPSEPYRKGFVYFITK